MSPEAKEAKMKPYTAVEVARSAVVLGLSGLISGVLRGFGGRTGAPSTGGWSELPGLEVDHPGIIIEPDISSVGPTESPVTP